VASATTDDDRSRSPDDQHVSVRPLLVVAAATIGAMLVASAAAWVALPDDAEIPIHWNLAGDVDGTASKAVGLLLTPLIAIGLTALLAAVPFLDPRRENMRRTMGPYNLVCSASIVFVGLVHLAVVWAALGNQLDIARLMGMGAAALFATIGLVMGRTRSNWFMGVRTPWTLSSELSWEKTHRLAGRLFLGAAGLMLLAAVVGTPELVLAVVVGSVLIVTVVTVTYSYLIWRDDPDRDGVGAHRGGSEA
jgi:uncharacterized membrane protein